MHFVPDQGQGIGYLRNSKDPQKYKYPLKFVDKLESVMTRDISNRDWVKGDPEVRKRRILVLDNSNLDSFCGMFVGKYTMWVEWAVLWKWGFGGFWFTSEAVSRKNEFGKLWMSGFLSECVIIWDRSLIDLS